MLVLFHQCIAFLDIMFLFLFLFCSEHNVMFNPAFQKPYLRFEWLVSP